MKMNMVKSLCVCLFFTFTAYAETDRLNKWFEQQYQIEVLSSPMELTSQGRKERYNEIDDFSKEAAEKQLKWKKKTVKKMKAKFDYDALDENGKLSWDLWEYQYEQQKRDVDFWNQGYVYHQMYDAHSYFPIFLINYHKVQSVQDMHDYLSRVSAIWRAVRLVVDTGIHAKGWSYQKAVDYFH